MENYGSNSSYQYSDDMESQMLTTKKKGKGPLIALLFFLLVGVGVGVASFVIEKTKDKPVAYEDIPFEQIDGKSMEFAVDGKVLHFPCTYKDLENAGFTFWDGHNAHEVLDAARVMPTFDGSDSQYMQISVVSAFMTSEKGTKIIVDFSNFDDEMVLLEDCPITRISSGEDEADFILCNGLTGVSGKEEIIDVMGEPDEKEEKEYNADRDESAPYQYVYYIEKDGFNYNLVFEDLVGGSRKQISFKVILD